MTAGESVLAYLASLYKMDENTVKSGVSSCLVCMLHHGEDQFHSRLLQEQLAFRRGIRHFSGQHADLLQDPSGTAGAVPFLDVFHQALRHVRRRPELAHVQCKGGRSRRVLSDVDQGCGDRAFLSGMAAPRRWSSPSDWDWRAKEEWRVRERCNITVYIKLGSCMDLRAEWRSLSV